MNEKVYHAISVHISTAIRSAFILDKLDQSYKKLVKQAHKEGMADISAGIMHNVGNGLNSVNSSVQMMREWTRLSPINDIIKANNLLELNIDKLDEFILNDPKGMKLMQFYLKLGSSIIEFRQRLIFQVDRLDAKMRSINDSITAQQNYAVTKTSLEELDLVEVIEDVLKMQSSLMASYKIEIEKDYKCMPKVMGQRVKLFHVLVSLIKNSIDSLMKTPLKNRKIKVFIFEDDDSTYVQVIDSGCGIPAHMIDTLFSVGFTTKRNGRGFGLQTCSIYMAEMDGKIWAESDGTGMGSTFVLQFEKVREQL
jgi:signal transduction histidine kinase